MYTANILFADQEIPTSPYKINVEPNIDVSKIKVVGLEPRKSNCICDQTVLMAFPLTDLCNVNRKTARVAIFRKFAVE